MQENLKKQFNFDIDIDLVSDFNLDDLNVSQFLMVFGNFTSFEETIKTDDEKSIAIDEIAKLFNNTSFKKFNDWFLKTLASNTIKYGDRDSFDKFKAVILVFWCLYYKEMERISELNIKVDEKEQFNKW